jgi:arginine N-succinyltransferase
MFLMRRARIEDVGTLLKLAKMVHFINLPADKDIIADKVMRSRESFLKAADLRRRPADERRAEAEAPGAGFITEGRVDPAISRPASDAAPPAPPKGSHARAASGVAATANRSDLFMFVLEDLESGGVLGTSQVIARMGGPGAPNVSLQLSYKEFFSKSLQVGAKHAVAKLVMDESGPTEIGGLILQPSYRGHKQRLGRFLSLIRFHFIALNRPLFSEQCLAEMMAPITADGHNTLWEYLGRRFINLTYTEADRFCQYSKEFMTSLLPREEIYLTLLPPEARAVVGEVGPETVPARRMLEKLGFAFHDRIDPFDGGPHLEARTADISIVRNTIHTEFAEPVSLDQCTTSGFISTIDADGDFRAVEIPCALDKQGRVRVTKSAMRALAAEVGTQAGFTPLDKPRSAKPANTNANGKKPRAKAR